ncbi:S9 family peptidase [Gammaproteobacteria bacterium]|nr:S9 family peptidase [Gammaproteobacteria bacterium]
MTDQTLPGDPSLPTDEATLTAMAAEEAGDYRYSVEDFFRTPEKSSFSLSPDGQWLAWLGPWQRRRNLFVQRIGENDVRRVTAEEERDIGGYLWANDDHLLYLKDDGGDENYHLYSVGRDGGDVRCLTPFDGVRVGILDDLEDIDDQVLLSMNRDDPQHFEPWRLTLSTGDLVKVASNDDPANPIVGWETDHDGKLRLASRIKDGVNTTLLYRETEDEDFREVITTSFRESLSPLFFDFENPNLAWCSTNLGRDKSVLVKVDLRTAEEVGEVLFSHPKVDVSGLAYSKKRKVLTAIYYSTDKRQSVFLDPQREALQRRLERDLPGLEVVISDVNREETRYLVRSYSDRSLGACYLYDLASDEMTLIAEISPWLDAEQMASMTPVSYSARDGLTIPAYLTLPANRDGKQVPVIVNPHGGPWVRDGWGYDPSVQLLASRGYAVLQMNYRGSTGYGREFWEKGFKQWGQSMQDDITDGVQWLIDEGIADADRVAIFGGSYGGYATLAGVTYTPDLYRCAVDFVGVSNLLTFMQTIPPYWKPLLEMMHEQVGDPESDREMLEAYSPALNADRITTPLFVVQGANDPRVNIDESDQIVRNLRDREIDVPYMVRYDEGHGFAKEENRFAFYRAMLGFFARHLK